MHSPFLLTDACEDRDFVEWHQGRPWCAVWVVRVEAVAVHAAVELARHGLADYLLPRYARQPHITLAYRGLMEGGAHCPPPEMDAARLLADVQALQAAQLAPFAWQLQGGGSFSTVPYVALAPCSALLRAHAVLQAVQPYPGWCYVPHITVGHYRRSVPMAQVQKRLQALTWPQCTAAVDALWLARYRSSDVAGPLYWEGSFDLRTQTYHPEPHALLRG